MSGEVVYANCGPSCAAGKSGFCNHVLALMLKVCKYTLYNCKDTTELQHEEDENSSTACTSTLQRWHQPRVEGISFYPVMEVAVSKTRLQTEQKSSGIMCHLYEARKVEMPTELNDFVETVKDIDPDLGLLQTCELNTGNGTDNHVDTRLGKSPAGAYRPPYLSLPLDDVNDDFLLHVPEDLDTLQNRLLNDLKVTMLDANKIEENTKAQHTCSAWTEERKFRFTASNFGRVSRRKRNHKKFCNDLLDAKPFRSASTDHGIKYEPVALREYEKYMHKIGRPIKVEKSGFFVSPNLF